MGYAGVEYTLVHPKLPSCANEFSLKQKQQNRGDCAALKQPLGTSRCRLLHIGHTNSSPVRSGGPALAPHTHPKLDPISGPLHVLAQPPTVSFSVTPKWTTPFTVPKFHLTQEALSEALWARTSLSLRPFIMLSFHSFPAFILSHTDVILRPDCHPRAERLHSLRACPVLKDFLAHGRCSINAHGINEMGER